MRIDQFLVEHFTISRSRARLLIKDGAVSVSGKVITKPSAEIADDFDRKNVTIVDTIKYVSRAGLKLEHVITEFSLPVSDGVFLDIGSSTGGFTDCLLQYGAGKVVAVDVGKDQFHATLKNNPHVELHEGTDIRNFTTDIKFNGIVCDISFISLNNIIPLLSKFTHNTTWFVLLIKPQFEVGKEFLNKQGIVKDENKIQEVTESILKNLDTHGIKVVQVIDSPILGGDGNRELLVYGIVKN